MKNIQRIFAAVLLSASCSVMAADGVARASFTTAIQDREPADQVGQLTNDTGVVYFFTELRGLEGQTVTHRWEHGGEVRAEVSFNVGGNRWRVWSSKNLQPGWLGEWQVSVVDEGGNVMSQESFAYIPAGEAAAESEPANEAAPAEAAPAETMPAETTPVEPPAAPANMSVE